MGNDTFPQLCGTMCINDIYVSWTVRDGHVSNICIPVGVSWSGFECFDAGCSVLALFRNALF